MRRKSLVVMFALLLCLAMSAHAMSADNAGPDPAFKGLNAPDWVDNLWRISIVGSGNINGNPTVSYSYSKPEPGSTTKRIYAVVSFIYKKGQKKYGVASDKGSIPFFSIGNYRMLGKDISSITEAVFSKELAKY